jgi:hypothetical protein
MSYGFDGTSLYFSQPLKWADKKQIVVKLEPSGKILFTKELSELGQVLQPASFAFDGKGTTLMTWIDETSPRLKAIYAFMGADGSVGKEDMIANDNAAILYVDPVHTPKGFAIFYSITSLPGQTDSQIRLKRFNDGSDVVVYQGLDVSGFDFEKVKDRYVLRPYKPGESGDVLVFDANLVPTASYNLPYPPALGVRFGVTDALTLTGTGPVAVGGGVIPMGIPLGGMSLQQKAAIYVSGAGRPYELLTEGTPHMFTSERPTVQEMDGRSVVGFSDRRFASITPMLALVGANGDVIKRDVTLEAPQVLTGRVQLVKLSDDTVRVFYPAAVPSKAKWVYRSTDLNINTMRGSYTLPPTEQRQQNLLDTAQKYAACRVKEDYQCVYDLLDPTYRSGVSKIEHEGRIKGLHVQIVDYKVESCKVLMDSSLGKCDGVISAKLPPVMMGKPIDESQRKVTQALGGEIWVFVNGSWYYAVSIPMLGYAIQW